MFSKFLLSAIAGPAMVSVSAVQAQGPWLARYQQRAEATEAHEPHWATPLVTTSPRVEEGFRADFVRQSSTSGTTWNLGNTKGLQIIPFARTELRFSPPPFFTHSGTATSRGARDGFGDVVFRLKYRLYGSSEAQHNAIVSAVLSASYPTGKQANGSCCAILTPMLELGKGLGPLALTTTISGTLPVSNTARLGRSIGFNNAVQYHITTLLWLETELNSTYYIGGKSGGKQQTFATPGAIVSRVPLVRGGRGPSPLALSLGLGEQIALTQFKTYSHSPVVSMRLRF